MHHRSEPAENHRDVLFYMPTMTPLLVGDPKGMAGGAEEQVLMLARELARRGYAVAIATFGLSGNLLTSVDGVEVVEHSLPRTRVPLVRTLLFYRCAFATLRANRAKVFVHMTASLHTGLVALAARLLGCRFMYATAGVVDFDLRTWESRRWVTWAFRLGVKLADEIIVQTDEQVPLCRERFGREPVLIKSISEPAEPQDPRPEAFVWAGWLREYKRPLAFVELARAVPEAQFWIVGVPVPGEQGQELAAAVACAAEAVPNLTLLAPRPRSELGALIERAVAVVSTSRTEGMPNVFMEGWARGVPALALAHDPDGVLEREALGGCAQGSPDRMAQLARDAWASREGRDEQSARCRAYVAREHSLERVADGWVEALGV